MLVDSGRYQKFSLQELVDEYETERFHAALAHYYYAKSIVDYHAKTGAALESLDEKKYGASSAVHDLKKKQFSGKSAQEVLVRIKELIAHSPELFSAYSLTALPHFDMKRLETLPKPELPSRINPDTHVFSGELGSFEGLSEAIRILREGYAQRYLRAHTRYGSMNAARRMQIRNNLAQEAKKILSEDFASASLHELRCFTLYARFRVEAERYVWFTESKSERASRDALPSASERQEKLRQQGEALLAGKFKGKTLSWVSEQAQKANDTAIAKISKKPSEKKASSDASSPSKPSLFARLGFAGKKQQASEKASTSSKEVRARNIDEQRARRAMEIYSALYFEHPTEFVDPAFLNPR